MRDIGRLLAAVGVIVVGVGAATAQRGDLPPVPITAPVNYTVQPRDTLDGIGAYFDVRVGCIREVNNLKISDILRPGQVLNITPECPAYDGIQTVASRRTNTPGRDGTDGTYVVRPNDTLDTIGQRLNVSVEALISANNITNPRTLSAGQVLVVPPTAPEYGVVPALILSPGAAAALEAGAAGRGSAAAMPAGMTYTVKAGDTVSGIAEANNISVIVLRVVNGLGLEPTVPEGTELFIPEGASAYGEFPKEGEIARLTEAIGSASVGGMGAAGIDGRTYVIQRNETLDGVGARFNVNHYCLIERNGITNVRSVRAGTLLIIPEDCGPYTGFDFVGTGASQ
jgi:LysM repeat protein